MRASEKSKHSLRRTFLGLPLINYNFETLDFQLVEMLIFSYWNTSYFLISDGIADKIENNSL